MRIVVLLVLLVLLGLVMRAQKRVPVLQYLFFARFPLLLALFLFGLPFAANTIAASLLKNLLSLSWIGIAITSLVAVLVSWVALIAAQLVVEYGPPRFGPDLGVFPVRPWIHRHRYALSAAVLAGPLIVALVWQSPSPFYLGSGFAFLERDGIADQVDPGRIWLGYFVKVLAALLGVGLAIAFLYLSLWLRATFGPVQEAREGLKFGPKSARAEGVVDRRDHQPAAPGWIYRHLPAFAQRELDRGYVDPDTRRFLPGHRLATAFSAITFFTYVVFGFIGYLQIQAAERGHSPPALFYLLWVALLLGWLLPALSFFLDRFRVPIVSSLIVLSILVSWIFGSDHFFAVQPRGDEPREVAAGAPIKASDAAQEAAETPIVVVAVNGGGITASLWTAQVLTGLQESIGVQFTKSIRVISSASGGSVGALYFLDRFGPDGYPLPQDLELIRDAAGRSSLDAAAWGIAYPDLWRSLFPFVIHPRTLDRGWALEQEWRQNLTQKDATLASWNRRIADRTLPAAIFNSTQVETGNPLLLTGLDLAGPLGDHTFATQYPHLDLPVVTAARLSSTFPFVSPITRPWLREGVEKLPPEEQALLRRHYADGGYFDNFGLVSIVRWLHSLNDDQRKEVLGRGLMLVRIRAFPESDPSPVALGWVYATLGPIQTLVKTWGSTQNLRGDVEVDLLDQLIAAWCHPGAGAQCAEKPFQAVNFVRTGPAPLSWKLTAAEKADILRAWKCRHNRDELAKVRDGFAVPAVPLETLSDAACGDPAPAPPAPAGPP